MTRSSPMKNADIPHTNQSRSSSVRFAQSSLSRQKSISCESHCWRSQSSYSCCGLSSLILSSFDSSLIVATSPCWVRSRRVEAIAVPSRFGGGRARSFDAHHGTDCQATTPADTVSDSMCDQATMTRMGDGGSVEERGGRRAAAEAEPDFVAAIESLLAGGGSYADLSVEQISAAAGRSRTAFYVYFRDKRELLMRRPRSSPSSTTKPTNGGRGPTGGAGCARRSQRPRHLGEHGDLLAPWSRPRPTTSRSATSGAAVVGGSSRPPSGGS